MNLYELLNSTINFEQRISSSLFSSDITEQLDNDNEKELYSLIKNICSLTLEEKDGNISYIPSFVNYENNTRSYSPEDFKDNDYDKLIKLDFESLPLNIKARLADFLWIEKRNFQFAKIAEDAYLCLFNTINDTKWYMSLKYIKRAMHISAKIKDKVHKEKCVSELKNKVLNLTEYSDLYNTLRLIEVLIPNLNEEEKSIESILDSLIIKAKNISEKEEIYKVKMNYYSRFKKQTEKSITQKLLADEFIKFAESLLSENKSNTMKSVAYFKKAIALYRNSRNTDLAEEAHKRLVVVQKSIPNYMHVHSQKIDLTEKARIIEKIFKEKSFEEAILLLGECTPFFKKNDVKSLVLEEHFKNPLTSLLFSQEILNDFGQTICVLNPLNFENPEKDLNLLEQHIHHQMFELEEYQGNFVIRLILEYIREHYSFKYESLEFLVKNNLIIPENRNDIFQMGIFLALNGQNYEAIHILAPQMENLFRNLAHELGGLTSTLDSDGQAKEKTLISIFETKELLDSYDNDILFLLKGLLNEPAGGNIRNEIAHGILSHKKSFNGACLYFIGACVKLLSFTCPIYTDYFQNKQLKEE